jgi:hypothetical protein
VESGYRRLVFVMIDGAPYEVLCDLLASGDLPALAALAEEGGGVHKAVTCFPSTTGPAYIPYMMGLFPGTANVPGYRWLSREHYGRRGSRWTRPGVASYSGFEGANFDADLPRRPTWFDYFTTSRNVINLLTQGCDPRDNLTRRVKPLVYAFGHYLHRWDRADAVAAEGLVAAAREAPDFMACAFNGVDGFSHAAHPRDRRVIESYRTIDRAVEEARRIYRVTGIDEETLWVIGSDHGQSATHTHIDVPRELERLGYPCLYYPRLWRRQFSCAEMISGNGMTQVYFKQGGGWGGHVPWEELSAREVPPALLGLEGIDFVAGRRGDGTIVLKTARGEGTVRWCDGAASYSFEGEDVLGCGPFEGKDAEEALCLTFDGPRPDAALQVEQLFRAERAGDLFVSAKQGFDLRARWEVPEHKSTHGALIPAQMHVPVIINHPIERRPMRTSDVFPTVLKLLGREPPDGIDGVDRTWPSAGRSDRLRALVQIDALHQNE